MGDFGNTKDKPKQQAPDKEDSAKNKLILEFLELQGQIRQERLKQENLPRYPYLMKSRSTIECHRPPEHEFSDFRLADFNWARSGRTDKMDRSDAFEKKWAKISDEPASTKIYEFLKHLPPGTAISTKDSNALVRMLLTASNTQLSDQEKELLKEVLAGVTSISNDDGSGITISRKKESFIPLPEKIALEGGLSVKGLKLGSISARFGKGNSPELYNIKGLNVELDVPTGFKALGCRDSLPIERLHASMDPTSGTMRFCIDIKNALPYAQRKTAGLLFDKVPQDAFITVPLFTVDRIGKIAQRD